MIGGILRKLVGGMLMAMVVTGLFLNVSGGIGYAEGACPTIEGIGEGIQKAKDGLECVYDTSGDNPDLAVCPAGYRIESFADNELTCKKFVVASEVNTKELLGKISFFSTIGEFLNSLLWPILVLIGGLLDNSLLFGNGMEARLREIWIPIRNLVNILFVIVLVGVALYNVLGLGEENSQYSIKSALPKIIVGIIAINFSFLGIKVFLDAVNVITVSIFALPGDISEGLSKIQFDARTESAICAALKNQSVEEAASRGDNISPEEEKEILYNTAKRYGVDNVEPGDTLEIIEEKINIHISENDVNWTIEDYYDSVDKVANGSLCTGATLNENGKKFLNRYGAKNAAFAMAINMGKLPFLNNIDYSALKDIEKLAINTIFSVVLYLVYTTSFLALFIVLLGRLVVMWLCIAVSPVLLLLIAAPDLKSKLGGLGEVTDQFVKNAIAPILIALAMTIGWIMLDALGSFNLDSAFELDPTKGIPVPGLNTLQDFTVAIATIAVIWMGVFTAAEGTVAKDAVGFIGENVKKAGKWIATLPFKHAPVIPIKTPDGGEGNYSLGEVLHTAQTTFNNLSVQDGLTKKFLGEGFFDPKKVYQTTTAPALKDWLASGYKDGRKLSNTDLEHLQKHLNTTQGDRLITELSNGNSNERLLAGHLRQLKDSKDNKSNWNNINDAIRRNPDILNLTNEKSKDKSAANEPKIIATTTVNGKQPKDTITGKAWQTYKENRNLPNDAKLNEEVAKRVAEYEDTMNKLKDVLNKPTATTQEITNAYNSVQFRSIKNDGTEEPLRPNESDLKATLDSDQFKKLKDSGVFNPTPPTPPAPPTPQP